MTQENKTRRSEVISNVDWIKSEEIEAWATDPQHIAPQHSNVRESLAKTYEAMLETSGPLSPLAKRLLEQSLDVLRPQP